MTYEELIPDTKNEFFLELVGIWNGYAFWIHFVAAFGGVGLLDCWITCGAAFGGVRLSDYFGSRFEL